VAYTVPTLDQFKEQFFRDFPYAVPSFGATGTAVVTAGVVTAIIPTAVGVFYQNTPLITITGGGGTGTTATATVSNNGVVSYTVTAGGTGYTTTPTVTVVSQDGDDTDLKKVTNRDITFAQSMCPANINQCLFPNQGQWGTCYNLLTAHFMVTNLLNSTQGIKSQYDWLTTQRSVGNVQSSFGIPDRVMKSAFLSGLCATRYGAQYVSMIWPYLHGNVRIAVGITTP
jgi:uncharacterized protein DUF4054